MRDLFARWAGPVTPHSYPDYPDTLSRGNRETPHEINVVTPITSVTPENEPQPHAQAHSPDHADLMDAYEERAAILQFDGHLSRAEAEDRAWVEVFWREEK